MSEGRIHPTAEVEDGARLGPGTVVWQLAHVRHSAVLGEQCTIGRGVFVDEDVVLGDRVKVQNHALLYRPARPSPAAARGTRRRPRGPGRRG